MRLAGLRGYTPTLASAVNTLLNAKNDIEYTDALKQASNEINGYSVSIEDSEEVQAYAKSGHFGLPIYMPVLLEKIDGTNGDLLLESAVLEISRTKNIVITDVQGRDESVKEFINNGDYSVSFSGIIASNGASYPKSAVVEFEKFMKAKQALPIVHELLNALGIYEVVITDYALPNSPYLNIQEYKFNAVSDSPVELKINE